MKQASPLTIDVTGLIENIQGAAKKQVEYLADMARADALKMLDETGQAVDMVDRHLWPSQIMCE